jgi:hypothetical protein
VAGTLVGHDGDSVLIRTPVGVIRTIITGNTEVCTRGELVKGDTSLCDRGDRIVAGTTFNDDGVRVANWLYTNGVAMIAKVSEVDADYFVVLGEYGSSTSMTVKVTPNTRFYLPGGGFSKSTSVLHVGDSVHFTATAGTPGYTDTCWGYAVHKAQRS